jgi:PKD domain/PQQ-like domain
VADSVYWTNDFDNTIQDAPLAGGGTVETLYGPAHGVNTPRGLAIDPAAGRIYWTNSSDDKIRGAPLDGSGPVDTLYDTGQGVSDPFGVAIDKAAERIYWSQSEWDNGVIGKIRHAPLAGGGPVVTLYDWTQGVFYPSGLAIDPAAGRIYWGEGSGGTIQGAPLAGGGPVVTLYGSAPGVIGTQCVAIDKAAGRIYWANGFGATIQGAPLAGGGTVNSLYDSARGVSFPTGVAIDPNPAAPEHLEPERLEVRDTERFARGAWLRDLFSRPSSPPGRIYWTNGVTPRGIPSPNPSDNTVRGAPLAGGGTVDALYGPAQVSLPTALALLRAPVGTRMPAISWSFIVVLDEGHFGDFRFGGSHSGPLDRRLTCTRGTWAADLPGSLLYRAPQSFAYQWRLNGTDIGGATTAAYTPSAPGTYTCRVTASNRAGSAAQTSPAVTIS